jgi:hypothetical protein
LIKKIVNEVEIRAMYTAKIRKTLNRYVEPKSLDNLYPMVHSRVDPVNYLELQQTV